MPTVSQKTLSNTSNSIQNYVVYIGDPFPVYFVHVHVGLGSQNHLRTIQEKVDGPVYEVLKDNRKLNNGKKVVV